MQFFEISLTVIQLASVVALLVAVTWNTKAYKQWTRLFDRTQHRVNEHEAQIAVLNVKAGIAQPDDDENLTDLEIIARLPRVETTDGEVLHDVSAEDGAGLLIIPSEMAKDLNNKEFLGEWPPQQPEFGDLVKYRFEVNGLEGVAKGEIIATPDTGWFRIRERFSGNIHTVALHDVIAIEKKAGA